jgi:hypothetical protein
MKTNKSFHLLTSIVGSIALSMASTTVMAEQGKKSEHKNAETAQKDTEAATAGLVLEYKLALSEDGKSYQILMKPSATPKPDISLTGQVTLKVPHDAGFKAVEIKSAIEGSNWVEASRVDAPKEDATHDYISFSFVGLQGTSSRNYAWEAGKEELIFSLANAAGCVDGVSLMANDDPFNVSPNSTNTNPGNQFTNLGWGAVSENNYKGNYGNAVSCRK